MQTTDEVHILVPTKQDVHKSDLSFQVHPKRLKLTVKGDSLLSGDLPEAVDIDGTTSSLTTPHDLSTYHSICAQSQSAMCRVLLGL